MHRQLLLEIKSDDEDDSRVLLAKGVTMVVLASVSTLMGLIPMQLARWFGWNSTKASPRSTKIVTLLLGFGGGALLSTTFLHLLPEVTLGVVELVSREELPVVDFSLAESFVCFGFFVIYLVEESVHAYMKRRTANSEKSSIGGKDAVEADASNLAERGNSAPPLSGQGEGFGHDHSHLSVPNDGSDDSLLNSLRGLLIVLSLSVHELFEGLAIGLESTASYVWYMSLAVGTHKFVIAFCLGVELMASRTTSRLTVVYVCTFAFVSPIGIGVGMLLVGGSSAAASGSLPVILQGMATGTLLYVVFFEILQKHRSGLDQFSAVLVGFLTMSALEILTEPHSA